ncbi:MAG: hypothetical protein WDN49_13300 [Acetobacteraceae bacterium]
MAQEPPERRSSIAASSPLAEQQAVGQLRERIVLRHEPDAHFGAAPLGDVLVDCNPAAIQQWLVRDCDQPPVSERLHEGAGLPPVDERLAFPPYLIDGAARIVADGDACGQHISEGCAGPQRFPGLAVDLAEAFVCQLQPILGVIEA